MTVPRKVVWAGCDRGITLVTGCSVNPGRRIAETAATLSFFPVRARRIQRGAAGVGDPLDLSLRPDNLPEGQAETPGSVPDPDQPLYAG